MVGSPGAILLDEAFTYPDGPLVTVSGGKWLHHSPSSSATGELQVVSGRVQLTRANNEDVSTLLPGQPYDAAGATNIFFASFTVRFTALPSAAGNYFAHFKAVEASSGFRARIWAFSGGATPGSFRLGISSSSGSAINVTNPTELALNTDYKVVTRLVNSNSVATLWIDPTSESDPSVATSEAVSAVTVAAYAFREDAGIGVMTIDALLVGTTFADVVPALPDTPPTVITQPQSQSVFEGMNVTFRAATDGSAPRKYQWQFNGTNLFAATNETLTLANVSAAQAGSYVLAVTNLAGWTNSQVATLTVKPAPPAGFSLLTYNTHGGAVEDWSTNSPQVQAIGRQVSYLNPDIITFQEIPFTNTHQMVDFVAAYLPGYALATNSGTDGYIRSVIASRFPIARSQKWLDGVSLTNFGYDGYFTRDLFEAEIVVPNFFEPLHVFTTHLKSGQAADESSRRAAEASAISNFFVTVFLPAHGSRPYVLTGDMNEDIDRPPTSRPRTIERLTSAPTGLHVTTPVNAETASEITFSIRGGSGLTKRYDYILPGGLLFSNAAGGQVFRTDLSTGPPPLRTNDSATASDHLPVMMKFYNPYATPFRLGAINLSNQVVTLQWASISNRQYRVDVSADLNNWTPFSGNLTATGTNSTFSTNVVEHMKFFRVLRLP